MTHILDRLRNMEATAGAEGEPPHIADAMRELYKTAADEIERLQGICTEIRHLAGSADFQPIRKT